MDPELNSTTIILKEIHGALEDKGIKTDFLHSYIKYSSNCSIEIKKDDTIIIWYGFDLAHFHLADPKCIKKVTEYMVKMKGVY